MIMLRSANSPNIRQKERSGFRVIYNSRAANNTYDRSVLFSVLVNHDISDVPADSPPGRGKDKHPPRNMAGPPAIRGHKVIADAGSRPDRCRRAGMRLRSVEAQPPAHLVFVHDRVGIPVGDAGVIGEPYSTFVAAQERGARFEAMEPLSEVTAGDDRYAGDQAAVHIR